MTASNLACATKLSKRDVREIVNAAFMESVVDFQACNFPGGVIPSKQSTETTGVPVLSFKTWSSLHDRLFEGELCPSMPTQIVDGSWIHHAQHWASFEHRCFSTLRYFFEVFGPVDKNSLHQGDTSKQNGIRGPLQQWIPTTNFRLCSEFSGVLEEAEGRYNPFTCPTTSKHENIPEYPLTDEFSAMLKTAVTKVRHDGTARGLWVKCGGKAPMDYILIVLRASSNTTGITVSLRFADAKHTRVPDARFPDMSEVTRKGNAMHMALRYYIELSLGTGTVVECFDPNHVMVCHNTNHDKMFSPSTFRWHPWSEFLFCDTDSGVVEGGGTRQTAERTPMNPRLKVVCAEFIAAFSPKIASADFSGTQSPTHPS